MRVLFLTKRYYTNKDLISDQFGRLFHLPVELGRRGHEVAVLALDYRGHEEAVLDADGVEFLSLPAGRARLATLWHRVKVAAGSFHPDVVVGSADTHLGWIAHRVARRLQGRFVFDLYDNYRSFASARLPGMRRLFDGLLSSADLIVAASEPLAEFAARRNGEVVLIVNGVDRKQFHPINQATARQRLGIGLDRKLVGYIGSVEPDRGIEFLVEAVDMVRAREPQVSLVAAGVDRMEFSWNPAVHDYRGVLPQSEVPLLISACDVVVLPYLANEWGAYTYPNKLAEYIACGVPVVATDVSGFSRVVGDGFPGLCQPADPVSMAAALRSQLESPTVLPTTTASSWAELASDLEQALITLVASQ